MTPGVRAFEAIPQGYFLEAMGINARIEMLSKNSKPSKIDRLESEYKRLVSKEEMGEIYKVQIITLKEYGEIYPHITSDPNVF